MIETRSVHEQLAAVCLDDLAAGRWQPGQQFPSERELAATYQLSRSTANKVLAKLVSEGWLEMRKGLGCFVAERPTLFASLRRIESFTDFARGQGFVPSTRVLEFRPGAECPDKVRSALKLEASAPVIFVRRLRLIDREPVILEERWLPESVYPGLAAAQLKGSFYRLCRERFGITVQREEADLRAAMAPAWPEAAWTEPALRLEGLGFDGARRPLWYQVLHYHGARFTLNNVVDSAAAVPSLALQFGAGNPQPPTTR